jgi:hypothetical protein
MAKTKRERFVAVTERRTRRILKNLQLLGNCSRRAAYEYTDDDVRKIFRAIDASVRHVRELFAERRAVDFSLDKGDQG